MDKDKVMMAGRKDGAQRTTRVVPKRLLKFVADDVSTERFEELCERVFHAEILRVTKDIYDVADVELILDGKPIGNVQVYDLRRPGTDEIDHARNDAAGRLYDALKQGDNVAAVRIAEEHWKGMWSGSISAASRKVA